MAKKQVEQQQDPARAALAEQIVKIAEADRELEAMRNARDKAAESRRDAEHKLELLQEAKTTHPADYAAGLMASALSGAEYDPVALAQAAADDEAQAAQCLDIWEKAVASCEAEIERRQSSKVWGESLLTDLALDVIRHNSGPVVDRLLDGLDRMAEEVLARRLSLRFLLTERLIPEDRRSSVSAALAVDPQRETHHPALAAWRQAIEALKTDADAPLPG